MVAGPAPLWSPHRRVAAPGGRTDVEGVVTVADAELLVEVTGPVATVVIRNPARRNAMTAAMWRRLPALLDGLEADPAVRALVLTGAGDTFCAGADLGDLDELLDAGDASIAVAAEERLAAFAKPTVAAVRGACVGGGCQLAVACDLRVATADARFGVPPARLGLVYPAPTTRRLARLVGPGRGQAPALHRRADRRRAGAAGGPGRRGAAGRPARRPGGRADRRRGRPLPAQRRRRQGDRRRAGGRGPDRVVARAGPGQRRGPRGCRGLPRAPPAPASAGHHPPGTDPVHRSRGGTGAGGCRAEGRTPDAAPRSRRPVRHRPASDAQVGTTGSRRSGMPASVGVRSPLRWLQP